MARDKAVDSAVLDSNLASIADAIRKKGATTEDLSFPDGFVSAVNEIVLHDTVSVDMSGWGNGSFTETYVNGTSEERTVEFDDSGRPVRIENHGGNGVNIRW